MEYELNDLRWCKQQEITLRLSAFCWFYKCLSVSWSWHTLVVGSVHPKYHWYVCDWSLLPTYYAWNSKNQITIVIRISHIHISCYSKPRSPAHCVVSKCSVTTLQSNISLSQHISALNITFLTRSWHSGTRIFDSQDWADVSRLCSVVCFAKKWESI